MIKLGEYSSQKFGGWLVIIAAAISIWVGFSHSDAWTGVGTFFVLIIVTMALAMLLDKLYGS